MPDPQRAALPASANPASPAEGSGAWTVALAMWLLLGVTTLALLISDRDRFPLLHTTLDTAKALLPATLAWFLWEIGRRTDRRLPQLLAATLALTALLNIAHVLVPLEWSGSLHIITEHAPALGAATWGAAAYVSPGGLLFALLHGGGRRQRLMAPVAATGVVALLVMALFTQLPRPVPAGPLGIAQWFLVGVPLLWAAVALLAFRDRRADRLLTPLALTAATSLVASIAMLWSDAAHDAPAQIAHLGQVGAYLLFLLALLNMATVDMQARHVAEATLAQTNALLEQRVRTRTAELARSYQDLSTGEQKLRAFVGATHNVIYRMSADWSEMHELQGRDFNADTSGGSRDWLARYIHPDDRAAVMRGIQAAIRDRSVFELEHRVIRVDGGQGWAHSRAIPILDERGDIIEWFGAATDVTQRRLAEERLQAQLARLSLLGEITRAISDRQDAASIFQVVIRTLESQMPVDFACICLHDAADHHMTIARIGARSGALSMGLALPDRMRLPIDSGGFAQCMQGQVAYEADISRSPSVLAAKLAEGGLRSLVIAPLMVDEAAYGALVAARRTVDGFSSTDCEFLRMLGEHLSLATHQADLHSALQMAYEDLRESQQTVLQQERLRVLGQLASGIAHDINNALSPAALYTQALLEQESGLSDEVRGRLAIIGRAIDDVSDTVARMRAFYRQQDAGLKLAPVNLNGLIEQVAELTRARWKDVPQKHGVVIELHCDLASQVPAVLGAESEIRDAFANLVLNAVDAMPKGGTLTLRSQATGSPGDGGTVVVEICDTGVGMPEAVRQRCLEPFFSTKGERGSGLGLAMVYGMAQRHGAELQIESEPGRGTTVRLVFPAEAAQTGAVPVLAELENLPLRLLLIDDDPLILHSLQDVLAGDGHTVTVADGGQSGIEEFSGALARGANFDVVITDLGMPRVDGRGVAAAVKRASPRTPVLLLTGWGLSLQADGELPEHVDAVLPKPPRLSDLRTALANLMGGNSHRG